MWHVNHIDEMLSDRSSLTLKTDWFLVTTAVAELGI